VIIRDVIKGLQQSHAGFVAQSTGAGLSARTVILATGLVDRNVAIPGLSAAIDHGTIRYCPICDGFEASDLRIGVLGRIADACNKALFLRTYSKDVTLLTPVAETRPAGCCDVLANAGVRLPPTHVGSFERQDDRMIVVMSNGAREVFDVIYPVLGCDVRSELGGNLGARHNDVGCLEVDAHQQTTVQGLYAVGDVVSDLHQIAVGTGHAAVAATHIHGCLPRNFR
jgi:thioredoxin reductase (NADPH)